MTWWPSPMSQSTCIPLNDAVNFVMMTFTVTVRGSQSSGGMSAHIHTGSPTMPGWALAAVAVLAVGTGESANAVTNALRTVSWSAVRAGCWKLSGGVALYC